MIRDYVNVSDSYKTFKELEISKKDYVELNNIFNKFQIMLVLNGHQISLPQKMGKLFVKGTKQKITFEDGKVKGLAPDWSSTKKLWESNEKAKKEKKIVYHLNNHTDGFRYKFFWSRSGIPIQNKVLYIFRATRFNKRALSKKIKSGFNYKT